MIIPYIFSDYELECIFKSADNVILKDKKADPYLAIEFPVIVRLLYSCGLRIGVTIRLLISDIDLDKGILWLVNTKGNKQRLVPMSSGMTDILLKYCLAMGISGSSNTWLFPSSRGNGHMRRMSPWNSNRFRFCDACSFTIILYYRQFGRKNTRSRNANPHGYWGLVPYTLLI